MAPKNRMSSLPMAQFCAHSPRLSQIGSGRAAAMSSVFHAICADAPGAVESFARLPDDERDEIMTWKSPVDFDLEMPGSLGKLTLKYKDAIKEAEVALDKHGVYTADADAALTVGHIDAYWVVDVPKVGKVAVVIDLKRSQYTTVDGADSLQLMAYLLAIASKYGCAHGFTGIWSLTEGEWSFGRMLDMSDDVFSEIATITSRVLAAARNTEGDYSMGGHCNTCYGRLHCPSYLMPPEVAESSLAPFTDGTALAALSPKERGELLQLVERAVKTAEAAKAALKAGVYAGLPVDADGKTYKPVKQKGRASFDAKTFEAEQPELARKYIKLGAPFDTFRWVKA
jgi:hypothetical protein